MEPELWQRVKTALAEAMALSGSSRDAYLARLGAADAALRADTTIEAGNSAFARAVSAHLPRAHGGDEAPGRRVRQEVEFCKGVVGYYGHEWALSTSPS